MVSDSLFSGALRAWKDSGRVAPAEALGVFGGGTSRSATLAGEGFGARDGAFGGKDGMPAVELDVLCCVGAFSVVGAEAVEPAPTLDGATVDVEPFCWLTVFPEGGARVIVRRGSPNGELSVVGSGPVTGVGGGTLGKEETDGGNTGVGNGEAGTGEIGAGGT
jgi:hypothetical protein